MDRDLLKTYNSTTPIAKMKKKRKAARVIDDDDTEEGLLRTLHKLGARICGEEKRTQRTRRSTAHNTSYS